MKYSRLLLQLSSMQDSLSGLKAHMAHQSLLLAPTRVGTQEQLLPAVLLCQTVQLTST